MIAGGELSPTSLADTILPPRNSATMTFFPAYAWYAYQSFLPSLPPRTSRVDLPSSVQVDEVEPRDSSLVVRAAPATTAIGPLPYQQRQRAAGQASLACASSPVTALRARCRAPRTVAALAQAGRVRRRARERETRAGPGRGRSGRGAGRRRRARAGRFGRARRAGAQAQGRGGRARGRGRADLRSAAQRRPAREGKPARRPPGCAGQCRARARGRAAGGWFARAWCVVLWLCEAP